MDSHSRKVVQENRDYTMFSWSVQGASNPIHMKRGQGVWFWDGDDNRWLDFSSQLINLNIGHQHPKMLEAIKKQVDELCFAGPGFATEPRGLLGKKLAEVTGLAKAFFTLGGAEANENAMKMAKLFTGREKIITRYRSYHGATMGSMTASGDPRRWPVEPGIPGIVRVFDPYCYRCPFGQKVETCHRECVSHIEEVIQMEGPHTVAAILVEGITGSNGLLVPPDDYYRKAARAVRQIRHFADRRRGHERIRTHREMAGHATFWHSSRHRHLREGLDERLSPSRRRDCFRCHCQTL